MVVSSSAEPVQDSKAENAPTITRQPKLDQPTDSDGLSMSSDLAVGFDSFCYHRRFGETTLWETPATIVWTTDDVVDRATDVGAEIVSLQTSYLAIDPAHAAGKLAIARLAERLRERGLQALFAWGHRDGLKAGADPARVVDARAWIVAAAGFDVPLLRIVAGDQHVWRQPVAQRTNRLMPVLGELARVAADHGIALAIENHADFRMVDLVALVEHVGAANLGICLDFGNAVRVGDDLIDAARMAAPHTRMVHVKDLRIQPGSVGDPAAWWPTVPLGTGDLTVDGALDTALEATLASPSLVGWFVEMANMHPDTPDEDAAVVAGVAALQRKRDGQPISGPTNGREAGRRL